MNIHRFENEQLIKANIQELWAFISSPKNLEKITPPSMQHQFTTLLPDKVYPDLLIHHQIRPFLGIPLNWTSMIIEVKELEYFIDEQVQGPFAYWVHEHRLFPSKQGVIMKDIILYRPPFGFLGSLSNKVFIVPKLRQLFKYREFVLNELFKNG